MHLALAPEDQPVRPDFADALPLLLLLVSRRGDRNGAQLVAVGAGQGREDGNCLLAVCGVLIEQRDLLAAQLLHAARPLADVAKHRGRLVPISADKREDIGKDAPVRGVRSSIADGNERDPIGARALDQRVGHCGGERMDQRGDVLGVLVAAAARSGAGPAAGRSAAAVGARLALLPGELDAMDAAVALVQHAQIIEHARGDARRVGGAGAGPVEDELVLGLLPLGRTGERHRRRCRDADEAQDVARLHCFPRRMRGLDLSRA